MLSTYALRLNQMTVIKDKVDQHETRLSQLEEMIKELNEHQN